MSPVNQAGMTVEQVYMNNIRARSFDPALRKLIDDTIAYAKAQNVPEGMAAGQIVEALFHAAAVEFIETNKRHNQMPDPHQGYWFLAQALQTQFMEMYHDLYLDKRDTPDA